MMTRPSNQEHFKDAYRTIAQLEESGQIDPLAPDRPSASLVARRLIDMMTTSITDLRLSPTASRGLRLDWTSESIAVNVVVTASGDLEWFADSDSSPKKP